MEITTTTTIKTEDLFERLSDEALQVLRASILEELNARAELRISLSPEIINMARSGNRAGAVKMMHELCKYRGRTPPLLLCKYIIDSVC